MPLKDYRSQVWNCFRCSHGEYVGQWETKSARFSKGCPSVSKYLWDIYACHGRMDCTRALIEGNLEWTPMLIDATYKCQLCGLCDVQCKRMGVINVMDILMEMRIKCVEDGKGPPIIWKEKAEKLTKYFNIYGEDHEQRLNFVPHDKRRLKEELIYYVGCVPSYRQKNIAKTTLEVLEAAGINIAFLPDERCCGRPLYEVGLIEATKGFMKHNLSMLKEMKAKMLLFSCPRCLTTFQDTYVKLEDEEIFKFEYLHFTQLISELINKNKVAFKNFHATVTYHDPCYLGRVSGIYEDPRFILENIPGVRIVEMDRIKENAWCCGAGGGVRVAYPDFAYWTAKERLEEAEMTGADILVTACPECVDNLQAALKMRTKEDAAQKQLEVLDISEFLVKVIKGK